jgi:hypothetical protein
MIPDPLSGILKEADLGIHKLQEIPGTLDNID